MGSWTISIHRDSDFSSCMNRVISSSGLSVHITSLKGDEDVVAICTGSISVPVRVIPYYRLLSCQARDMFLENSV